MEHLERLECVELQNACNHSTSREYCLSVSAWTLILTDVNCTCFASRPEPGVSRLPLAQAWVKAF